MTTFQTSQNYNFFPSPLDTRARYIEDDESSILDDNILDHNSLDMPSMGGHRRDSFADSSAIFSPKEVVWTDFTDPDAGLPPHIPSTNPFHGQSNNPFARLDASQAAMYGQQSNSWGLDEGEGACTPTAIYDGLPLDYENKIGMGHPQTQLQTNAFSNWGGLPASHLPQGATFSSTASSTASIPPSPYPSKDWMQGSDLVDSRSNTKRMRPNTPLHRSNSPILRRDGIRKKNARFDIPDGRSLQNIDELIARSTDDQELKELKQQKRLLRNRQAALDSRQRKKQHTERLEEDKKSLGQIISQLETEMGQMKIRESEMYQEREAMQQQYYQEMQKAQFEKEEMVRSHTLETAELRKKVSFLTDHIKNMQTVPIAPTQPTMPYTTEFTDMTGNFDDSGAFDDFSFLNNFAMDEDPTPETSLIIQQKKLEKVSEEEKPAASSLLLMLLLFGAFVASKGSSSSSAAIPRMPDEVRAASVTVLDNIFKDAGVQPADPRLTSMNRVESLDGSSTTNPWTSTHSIFPSPEADGIQPSVLDKLHHQLTAPTAEQEAEQLFSLSTEQYMSITSTDFLQEADPVPSQRRRNLGETLAAMRHNKESAAEVYTRSLMWDKVPAEVVREFARMVSQANAGGTDRSASDGIS